MQNPTLGAVIIAAGYKTAPYNNLINYTVSICKGERILLVDLLSARDVL